mgnify:CR=1 FL=1
MCGISAILGDYNYSLIIESLLHLQNRGYDSAGIGILDTNFYNFKELGIDSIKNLDENKALKNLRCNNVISHTRWATHGGISENNCHPHISNYTLFNLVHNGIIENYLDLKEFLIKNNYKFYSETDSEVIVNLIEHFFINCNNINEAIEKAMTMCSGTWGLVIQYIKEPDTLYCIRYGSPLIIGKNEKFTMITSELSGFSNQITNYTYLEPNKLYIINNKNEMNFEYKLKRDVETELGNYAHWNLKEIYDQKDIVQRITCNGARIKNNQIKFGGLTEYREQLLSSDNIILVGCGTSYNACLFSKSFFYKLCHFKNTIVIDACNYSESSIPKNSKNVFIFVSQSGETKDLYSVMNKVSGLKIGLINVVESLIAREVDCGVYMCMGIEKSVASTKVFTAEILLLILIAMYCSNDKILVNRYLNDLRKLELLIQKELNTLMDIDIINNGFILGNDNLYPISLEAALKFKEITYSHMEALSCNSLKHGPLALVSDSDFTCIVLGDQETVFQEILARKGNILNIKKESNNLFSDILYIIHLQKYIYSLSLIKGINPDFPRNLAKVVTV